MRVGLLCGHLRRYPACSQQNHPTPLLKLLEGNGVKKQDITILIAARMIDDPMVTNCAIEGNPFHEYGIRVAELAGADFILNVAINKERKFLIHWQRQ